MARWRTAKEVTAFFTSAPTSNDDSSIHNSTAVHLCGDALALRGERVDLVHPAFRTC